MNTLQMISLGGRDYISAQSLLTFLDSRASLVVSKLKAHDTSLTDTEYFRGQLFEQENLKHAISPPTQTTG